MHVFSFSDFSTQDFSTQLPSVVGMHWVLAFLTGVLAVRALGMTLVWSLIFYFCMFSLSTFLHEMGHLVVSLLFGIPVRALSIGFGPLIFSTRINNVKYEWRLILLSGYVEPKDTYAFVDLCWWKSIILHAAGPFGNLIAASVFYSISVYTNFGSVIISSIVGVIMSFGVAIHIFPMLLYETFFINTIVSKLVASSNTSVVLYAAAANTTTQIVEYGDFFYLAGYNVFTACFNLLPLYPLDGGKIFANFVPDFRHRMTVLLCSGVPLILFHMLKGYFLLAWNTFV